MRKAVKGKAPTSPCSPGIRGFSLIELLIALTLLVAAVSLVPVYLSKGVSTAELKSSVRQIVSGLRFARSEAVSRSKEQVFLLDVQKREFTTHLEGKARELPKGLDLRLKTAQSEQISDDQGGIRFFPDGSSTGGEISVYSDAREFSIAVNWISGKVAVTDRGQPEP